MDLNNESQVKQFKLKRLIKQLDYAEGSGTSMISVIIPPGKKVSDIQKMLTDEAGKAERIKDRVNRQGVIRAINSVKERLKQHGYIPPNGLFIYSGEVLARGGKSTSKMILSFEPIKAINTSLYKCSNAFETKELKKLLVHSEKYGFIIVDGNGSLYGTVQGNAREVLLKFSVDLPKKHGRGGQSSMRFARTRLEKRSNYVKKVCENAVPCFITNDVPNVAGLIVAGYADFKNRVSESADLDTRLKQIIVNVADISYGGEQGFNQAIELSKSHLSNLKLVQEQNLIGHFYEEINLDTGKIVYGIVDTMRCLEDGAIEKLVVWDNLETLRVVTKDVNAEEDDEPVIKYLTVEQLEAEMASNDKDKQFDIIEEIPFIDWLAENHRDYGADLVFITDKSPEGSQFVKGFGGIGAFMRFKYDYEQAYDNEAMYDDDSDDDFI